MEKLRSVFFLVAFVTACSPRAPELRVAAPDAPSVAVESAKLAKVTAPRLSPSLPEKPPAPEAPEPAQCKLEVKEKHPAGFYPSDAWPKGEVVLTFDDGPHPGKTPKVLELLKKHQMPATFFLVGRNIDKRTYALVQRMVAEGHTLGTHSYNHDVGMAVRNLGERSVEYIRGQHETTRVLIELALVAKSPEDFDALFVRVFEEKAGTYLPAGSLRTKWRAFAERHAEVLAERGGRPYPMIFSRPPAGTPYVGLSTPDQKKLYDAALGRLGFLNVMWHGESGDTNPTRKHELGFLTDNLARFSRKGGVLLIHDYIRTDALSSALAGMAKNPEIRVVPIEAAVKCKYGCSSAVLGQSLAGSGSALVAAKD